MRSWPFLCISILFFAAQSDTARILAIFPFEGKSHFVMCHAIAKALAKRGHQVDVVSHFPLEKPIQNYRDVLDLRGIRPTIVGNTSIDLAKKFGRNSGYHVATFFGNDVCDFMGHERVQKFLKSLHQKGPYDVIVLEVGIEVRYKF